MKTKITILTAALLLAGALGGAHAASFSAAPGKDRPSGPGSFSDKSGSSRPSGPGAKAAPSGGATEDKYCKNGSDKYPACDANFVQACKGAGGTMSGKQGWGGKTCWEPS